jgi:hypothetical protein
MEDLSGVEEDIYFAPLAGASLIKGATLLGVSRTTISKVMSACTNPGKIITAKRNNWRKSTLTERDRRTLRRTVSKNRMNYCSKGELLQN